MRLSGRNCFCEWYPGATVRPWSRPTTYLLLCRSWLTTFRWRRAGFPVVLRAHRPSDGRTFSSDRPNSRTDM